MPDASESSSAAKVGKKEAAEEAKANTSGVKSFFSGGFGGVACVLVGHPFDLTKVRLQTAAPGTYTGGLDVVRQTFTKDGVRGFFRGMGSPLVGVTPMFAVSFWGYAKGRKLVYAATPDRSRPALTLTEVGIAGAFSGVPQTIVTTPVERIKVVLQTDSKGLYKGPIDAIGKLYAEGGIRSIYRGTFATLARDVPGSTAYFVTYEAVKKALTPEGTNPQDFSFGNILLAGGLAGVSMWTVAIPPDVIKSRLQSAPHGTYTGFVDCARQLIKHDGPTALFRGFWPAMARAFPANAATFLGVEASLKVMNQFF